MSPFVIEKNNINKSKAKTVKKLKNGNPLETLPKESLKLLLKIYNKLWTEDTFPDIGRQTTVIPIPKSGKDNSDPQNYRPISLTSCLCKIMEKMVNDGLVWYLETNGLISNLQCGFRNKRSTTDH